VNFKFNETKEIRLFNRFEQLSAVWSFYSMGVEAHSVAG